MKNIKTWFIAAGFITLMFISTQEITAYGMGHGNRNHRINTDRQNQNENCMSSDGTCLNGENCYLENGIWIQGENCLRLSNNTSQSNYGMRGNNHRNHNLQICHS